MSAFANKMRLELSKTVPTGKLDKKGKPEKERIVVGYAMVPYPSLADFGITAVQAKDEKTGELMVGKDDGIPVYADDKHDYLQQAIAASVAAKVRNYFSGTIKAKPAKEDLQAVLSPDAGKQLPVDFETLTAESARSGEALKIRREAKADFEAFLQGKNKKANVIAALGEPFYNSARVLGSASPKYVEALGMHCEEWGKGLTAEKQARFAPKLAELNESLNAAVESEELDLS